MQDSCIVDGNYSLDHFARMFDLLSYTGIMEF